MAKPGSAHNIGGKGHTSATFFKFLSLAEVVCTSTAVIIFLCDEWMGCYTGLKFLYILTNFASAD